ncbi:hypothetical protein Q7P37_002385 [Cladosporium fusiforme]
MEFEVFGAWLEFKTKVSHPKVMSFDFTYDYIRIVAPSDRLELPALNTRVLEANALVLKVVRGLTIQLLHYHGNQHAAFEGKAASIFAPLDVLGEMTQHLFIKTQSFATIWEDYRATEHSVKTVDATNEFGRKFAAARE